MRFDDTARRLTHHDTTVHVFSGLYAELSRAFHRPTPESPEGVYAFGKSSSWYGCGPSGFRPSPDTQEDDVLDAFVGYVSRDIDNDISRLR